MSMDEPMADGLDVLGGDAPAGEEIVGAGEDTGDYEARLRGEPDFAVNEVKRQERLIGERTNELNRFKPLDQYLSAVGGDANALVGHIARGLKILENPQLRSAYEEFERTGQFQAEAPAPVVGGEQDQYVDPDIRALEEKYGPQFESLRTENADLQQRLATAEARGLHDVITKNIDEHMKFWNDTGNTELAAEARRNIVTRVEGAERALADPASPEVVRSQARQLLSALDGDNGLKTLDMMNHDLMRANLGILGGNVQERERVESHRTDDPTSIRTSGHKPVPVDARLPLTDRVQQALERNTRKAGLNPDQTW